jgi:type I restriction enzyme S subunit
MKKGWPAKRLGDLFAFKNGRAFKKEEWTTKGLPIIRIQNLNNGDASFNYFAGEYSQDILVEPGDLLFSWSGTVGSSFGSHLWSGEPGVLNQHIFKIGLRETIAKRYAFHGLRYITAEIEQSVNGAVGLVHITKEKLNEFTLAVPPLAEQQRIVGLLDEAFEGLATAKANAEKNLQNARALFESHLQSVFTQRGPGWVDSTLSRATDGIFTGPFGSLLHKSDYVVDGIPLVNPAHITEVGIEPDLRKTVSKATALRLKNYIMREGDIVIGRRGEMGRCALVTEVEDGWLCGTGSFFIKPSSRCDTRYLVRFLRSDSCKARLEKIAGGAVMPNLSNTDLGNLTFDLPPLDRQKAIVEEIDSLHEETQRLARLYERKLAALEALKKSLLHQAFSGEL